MNTSTRKAAIARLAKMGITTTKTVVDGHTADRILKLIEEGLTPFSPGSHSLHCFDDTYLVDGLEYNVVRAISDPDDVVIFLVEPIR